MAVYNTNFVKTKEGNGIKSGASLKITIDGASHVSGGIYKDDLPIQGGFEFGDTIEFKLAKRVFHEGVWRTAGYAEGTYTLKIRIPGNGWDDEFLIF